MFNVYIRRNSEMYASTDHANAEPVFGGTTEACQQDMPDTQTDNHEVHVESDHFSVTFTPSVLEDPQEAQSLLSLIKLYCDRGGTHVQFRCVNSLALHKA